MRVISLILSVLSLSATLAKSEFKPEDVAPCQVHPVAQLYCVGEEVDDKVIRTIGTKLANEVFNVLSIHSTSVTELVNHTFTSGIFESIHIEDNAHLVSIHPQAFPKSTSLRNLVIRNNSHLSDPNVFAMARFLEPSSDVSLIGNALKEVPANAFVTANPATNRLRHIFLGKNKITQIGSNAFNHLPNLLELYVDHNPLTTIAANGLCFATSSAVHITVYLNDNQLSSTSFLNTSISAPPNGSMTLDLENNLFTDLAEGVFKQFTHNRLNQLFVYNNKFVCNCDMKWILDPIHESNLKGLYCFNAQKEIFSVTEKELGCISL